ncbi:MAG: GFA family protein [Phenylobacterium sp.]
MVKPEGPTRAEGACVCGAVRIEIGVPARWAWHDHSARSRHAQGCAYATYVGSYKSRFRVLQGEEQIARYEDAEAGTTRSFCARCGTPIAYERAHAHTMINLPRALFSSGVGREPLYHLGIGEEPEWAYRGERLKPLKGFPGVVWTGPKRRKARTADIL